VALMDVALGTALPDLEALAGRSVLVRTQHMLSAAIALIELDGLVRRLILCPPDMKDEHLPLVFDMGGVDAVVFDEAPPAIPRAGIVAARLSAAFAPFVSPLETKLETEWVMFTSGTTGAPKLVVHTRRGLTGAIDAPTIGDEPPAIWGTFYDIRRYGGLQVLLRALLGEGSLVLTDSDEDISEFLSRLGLTGATHLTGTPSHWRSVLMSPAAQAVSPRYIRLSGEIADQGVLDSLSAFYPGVPLVHAYASTEAGVGFEVIDGLEGIPASVIDRGDSEVQCRVRDDILHIRSARTARRYLDGAAPLLDDEGYVDTGDILERRGDRFYFVGRRGGVINVGGLKVHPQEVEAVINRHPSVRLSVVRGRRNPITGMVVVAEVVLDAEPTDEDASRIREEILQACHTGLERFKVPMRITFVSTLPITAGGKLERPSAV
jgi:acyl-coenzyme A synthetase/AMP-(fatty) acid ligase